MNPFHRQMSRGNISLSKIINQGDKTGPSETRSRSNVQRTLKLLLSQPFYLFSSSSCLCYLIFLSVCQAFLLSTEHISFLPSCLNSLRTPNANSVSHLIRHINSISPLIALIPLCNEFLSGIPSVQQNFKLRR